MMIALQFYLTSSPRRVEGADADTLRLMTKTQREDVDEPIISLLVLYYSNFIGVKWEKEALVPRWMNPSFWYVVKRLAQRKK